MPDLNELKKIPILKHLSDADLEKLAALVMVTRPASEIENEDSAKHWAGMPDYEPKDDPYKVVIAFSGEKERDAWLIKNKATEEYIIQRLGKVKSIRWPLEKRAKKHERVVVG